MRYLINIPMVAKSLKSVYNTEIKIYEYDEVKRKVLKTYSMVKGEMLITHEGDLSHVSISRESHKVDRHYETICTEFDNAYIGHTSNFLDFPDFGFALTSKIILTRNLKNVFDAEVEKILKKKKKHFSDDFDYILTHFEKENPEYFI